MPGKNEIIAWDTCIFLAWLNNEPRAPEEVNGVLQAVSEVENNKITLIASAIIYAEIYEASLDDVAREKFRRFTERSNVEIIPADVAVCTLVGELRQFYDNLKKQDGSKPLCLPDAVHLASAIIYQAAAFYTFDGKDSGKCRGLLPLDRNVGGHNLKVCKPPYTPAPPDPQMKLISG